MRPQIIILFLCVCMFLIPCTGCATSAELQAHNAAVTAQQNEVQKELASQHQSIETKLVPIGEGVNQLLTDKQREEVAKIADAKTAALQQEYDRKEKDLTEKLLRYDDQFRVIAEEAHALDKGLVQVGGKVAEIASQGLVSSEQLDASLAKQWSSPSAREIIAQTAKTQFAQDIAGPVAAGQVTQIVDQKTQNQPGWGLYGALASLLGASGAYGIRNDKSRKNSQEKLFDMVGQISKSIKG